MRYKYTPKVLAITVVLLQAVSPCMSMPSGPSRTDTAALAPASPFQDTDERLETFLKGQSIFLTRAECLYLIPLLQKLKNLSEKSTPESFLVKQLGPQKPMRHPFLGKYFKPRILPPASGLLFGDLQDYQNEMDRMGFLIQNNNFGRVMALEKFHQFANFIDILFQGRVGRLYFFKDIRGFIQAWQKGEISEDLLKTMNMGATPSP